MRPHGDQANHRCVRCEEGDHMYFNGFDLVKMCVTSNSDLKAIWKPLGSELQDRFINAFSLYSNSKFELIQG